MAWSVNIVGLMIVSELRYATTGYVYKHVTVTSILFTCVNCMLHSELIKTSGVLLTCDMLYFSEYWIDVCSTDLVRCW